MVCVSDVSYTTETFRKSGGGESVTLVQVYRCSGVRMATLDGGETDAPRRELVCTIPEPDAAGVLSSLADELGAEVSPP